MSQKRKGEITPRQRRFILEYLKDRNGAQAYIRAGYSRKSADANSARLLSNPLIKAEIDKRETKVIEKLELTAENVLRELMLLSFSNMRSFMVPQQDGSFVFDFSKITEDQAAAIQEATVEEFTDGTGENARPVRRIKFKLADKGVNLERLGKHLKLFTDRVEHGFDETTTALTQLVKLFSGATTQQLRELGTRTPKTPPGTEG